MHARRAALRANSSPIGRAVAALIASVFVAVAAPSSAGASPPDLFGFGTRSPAMAGTGVSYANDYEATFVNPAGLVRTHTRSLVLGLQGGVYRFLLDDERLAMSPVKANTIGATIPARRRSTASSA